MKKHVTRYQEIVENLNDAVYTVDIASLLFTSVNAAGERLTGYQKEEVLLMRVPQIVAPEYLPIVKQMIRKKRRKQDTIYEVEIVRKDGRRIPVEISSRAIYEGGVPVEIIGVARDITERRMIEMQRSVFMSLLTHEIKNPLTSVGMYVSLLSKILKDSTAVSYLSSISVQLKSIDRLLSDFMDATQIKSGKFVLHEDRLNMNELIQDIARNYPVSTHTVVYDGQVKNPVLGDKNRLEQVLLNLLSNAIKYSAEGSRVTVSLSEIDDSIRISVADSGFGIPKEEQKSIFDLFMRSTEASRKNIRGNGLGLYICREIIKAHKGKIWLESTVGVGSTFYVSLPTYRKKQRKKSVGN